MKTITRLTAMMLLLAAIGFAAPKPTNFEIVEITGASIYPRGINNNGDISGELYNENGAFGFIKRGDQVTLLAVPGAIATRAWGIDDEGRVAGNYYDAELTPSKGFLYENGQYTTLVRGFDIYVTGISKGKVVGRFDNHGFLYVNGEWTQLDYPGAQQTAAWGIGSDGRVFGFYTSGVDRAGFSWLNGQFESIQFPRVSAPTEVYAGSSYGIIGGVGSNCIFEAFIFRHGKFYLFDLPIVQIWGINDAGTIVGQFGNGRGFIAKASAFISKGQ